MSNCTLPRCCYKLKLSVCLYNKYLVRYRIFEYFEGFLSHSHHTGLWRVVRSFCELPYVFPCPSVLTNMLPHMMS